MTILNIGSLLLVTHYISEETLAAILDRWGVTLHQGVPSPSFTIIDLREELAFVQQYYFFAVGTIQLAVMAVLVFIVSKVVLEPIREAIGAQRNFIGYTAHELRTPLSIARTNIEATLLTKASNKPEDYVEELKRTMVELDTLAGIINNLVTLNALGNFEPAEYHHYDLTEILGEVARANADFAERKEVALDVESTPGLMVWANRNGLKQMIGNIVGNAINFSDPGKHVSVRAFQYSPQFVRLVVQDEGIGIAEDDLPYIFKPFYRSPAIQSNRDGGSGLGLAIVRELVRLHRGSISLASVKGEGTTVTVDLPVFRRRAMRTGRARKDEQRRIGFDFSQGGHMRP